MVSGKMYVKWKLILSFGTIFWILLCLYDIYFIDPVTKFYYADSDEYGWLATVSEDEINSEPIATNLIEDIAFTEEKYSFGECLLFWNVIIFITTVTFCIGSKLVTNHLWAKNKTKEIFHTETNKKNNGSKIPVFSMASKSVTNMLENNDCTTLKSTSNLNFTSSRGDMTSKHMEKQCAKLRDEMIAIQSSSFKEHAVISKKLELAIREKRELCKKLNIVNKESVIARQQVEQLLSEKCSLLERLECASKEFKQNTKSKKTALAKLEESQVNVAMLMKEVEKYCSEKNELENKYKKLDLENQQLKECVNYYENCQNHLQIKNVVPEQEETFHSFQEATKMKNEERYSPSHRDVQKVEKRLIDLEKSLDKLKYTSWKKHDSKKTNIQSNIEENIAQQLEIDLAIPTIPETPLEIPHKQCKLLTDNLTDEQRQKILIPRDYVYNELPTKSKNKDKISFEFHDQKTYEPESLNLKRFEVNTSKHYNPSFPQDLKQEVESIIENEDEDSDETDAQSRIISNSPAFQRFLHKMDNIDKLQAKYAIPTNMF